MEGDLSQRELLSTKADETDGCAPPPNVPEFVLYFNEDDE